MSVIKRT